MTLAYIDSFAGLIPCRVLAIECDAGSGPLTINYIRVKVTARNNRAYAQGQILELTGRAVVPRHAVRGNRILPYAWKDCAPGFFQ